MFTTFLNHSYHVESKLFHGEAMLCLSWGGNLHPPPLLAGARWADQKGTRSQAWLEGFTVTRIFACALLAQGQAHSRGWTLLKSSRAIASCAAASRAFRATSRESLPRALGEALTRGQPGQEEEYSRPKALVATASLWCSGRSLEPPTWGTGKERANPPKGPWSFLPRAHIC